MDLGRPAALFAAFSAIAFVSATRLDRSNAQQQPEQEDVQVSPPPVDLPGLQPQADAEFHSDPVFQEFKSLLEAGQLRGAIMPRPPIGEAATATSNRADIEARAHAAELLLRASRLLSRTDAAQSDTATQSQITRIRSLAVEVLENSGGGK